MAERLSGYQQGNNEKVRRTAGAFAEYGGAAIGILALLGGEFGAAIAAGAVALIGRWVHYNGTDSRVK